MFNKVDTRLLKSGRIRMRFKMSEFAHGRVQKAMSMTGYRYDNTSLDVIGMSYQAAYPATFTLNYPTDGSSRLLVKLFPDEYESIRDALDLASEFSKSDEESLAMMCELFISFETASEEIT
jgi:hypothetical protein